MRALEEGFDVMKNDFDELQLIVENADNLAKKKLNYVV